MQIRLNVSVASGQEKTKVAMKKSPSAQIPVQNIFLSNLMTYFACMVTGFCGNTIEDSLTSTEQVQLSHAAKGG